MVWMLECGVQLCTIKDVSESLLCYILLGCDLEDSCLCSELAGFREFVNSKVC